MPIVRPKAGEEGPGPSPFRLADDELTGAGVSERLLYTQGKFASFCQPRILVEFWLREPVSLES